MSGREAAGAVVVTLNYRLGPFGFLRGKELCGGLDSTGNEGMLDVVAALNELMGLAAVGNSDAHVLDRLQDERRARHVRELAAQPRDHQVHRPAGGRLDDEEVRQHDADQRRDHEQQPPGEVGEHQPFFGSSHQVSKPRSYFGGSDGRPKRSQYATRNAVMCQCGIM